MCVSCGARAVTEADVGSRRDGAVLRSVAPTVLWRMQWLVDRWGLRSTRSDPEQDMSSMAMTNLDDPGSSMES